MILSDIVFVAIIIAFFVVAKWYAQACDKGLRAA
jgi:hypothetical protein